MYHIIENVKEIINAVSTLQVRPNFNYSCFSHPSRHAAVGNLTHQTLEVFVELLEFGHAASNLQLFLAPRVGFLQQVSSKVLLSFFDGLDGVFLDDH